MKKHKIQTTVDGKTTGRIKASLRRLFLTSGHHSDIIKRARIARGIYKCERCGTEGKAKDLHVHHKVEVQTATCWNSYVTILFCEPEGLEAICKTCHKEEHKK